MCLCVLQLSSGAPAGKVALPGGLVQLSTLKSAGRVASPRLRLNVSNHMDAYKFEHFKLELAHRSHIFKTLNQHVYLHKMIKNKRNSLYIKGYLVCAYMKCL